MSEITNRTKRLVAELTVLVCIVCIWIVKSTAFDIDDVKAGVFEQIVKADTDNVDAYRFLADYYMDSSSYEKAVRALRRVVQIDPNDAYAHSMLGDAYWNCGRNEEAIVVYKQAMKLRADNPHIRYQIVLAYLAMGDKKSALKEYDTLKSMDEELAKELDAIINE